MAYFMKDEFPDVDINSGHYGIEHIFMEDMRQYLGSHLTDVEVMAAPIVHPFTIM